LFINYHQIIVLLKQLPTVCRIHLLAGRCASIDSVQHTEFAADQLSRFPHKRPVAFEFAEYKPNGLSCVWCNVGGLKQSWKQSPKSRKRFVLSGATCHKDRSTRLWKTYKTKWLKACVGAWSWRWTLQTFTVTREFCHLII